MDSSLRNTSEAPRPSALCSSDRSPVLCSFFLSTLTALEALEFGG